MCRRSRPTTRTRITIATDRHVGSPLSRQRVDDARDQCAADPGRADTLCPFVVHRCAPRSLQVEWPGNAPGRGANERSGGDMTQDRRTFLKTTALAGAAAASGLAAAA